MSHFFECIFRNEPVRVAYFCLGTQMKEWNVIHQIKALYNNGYGLSERKIAKKLGLSLLVIDPPAPNFDCTDLELVH